jgi:hypothetical protein
MRSAGGGRSVAGMEHIGTVQEIYGAFGRGDIPAILDRLAEDVVFEPWADHSAQAAGVPWLARREGRDGVMGFFESLGAPEFNALEPQGFLAGVTALRHYVDTAKHIAAV